MKRKKLGQLGEKIAQQLLISSGYQIIDKNYRCFLGEIDLIAKEMSELVFIEVRTRTSFAYGTPGDSISWIKQRRLRRLAYYYLNDKGWEEIPCRFDVVLIQLDGESRILTKEIIKDAF